MSFVGEQGNCVPSWSPAYDGRSESDRIWTTSATFSFETKPRFLREWWSGKWLKLNHAVLALISLLCKYVYSQTLIGKYIQSCIPQKPMKGSFPFRQETLVVVVISSSSKWVSHRQPGIAIFIGKRHLTKSKHTQTTNVYITKMDRVLYR